MSKPNMFVAAEREDWMSTELELELTSLAINNKIACAQAQQFATKHAIPLANMRKFMDVLQLKVSSCQLGCF